MSSTRSKKRAKPNATVPEDTVVAHATGMLVLGPTFVTDADLSGVFVSEQTSEN
jgi:hypothetical protein